MNLVQINGNWVWTAEREELQRWMKFGSVSPEGIIYNEELANQYGMDYILFPATHHTEEDVNKTIDWLRDTQDVVTISVGKPIGEYPLPRKVPTWTPEQREAGFRKIVTERAFGPVENCLTVDMFTASAVVTVLDGLSSENKARFLSRRASEMIDIAWKIVGNASAK
jgi:hypothetical protein